MKRDFVLSNTRYFRHYELHNSCPVIEDDSTAIEYKIASSKKELTDAYRLVYKKYLEKSYMKPNSSSMRVSLFNMLPLTKTIVAIARDTIIGCITVIPDSAFGLPMDEVYADELSRYRNEKRFIAEVSAFVVDKDHDFFDKSLFLKLILLFLGYARNIGVEDLCIAVNPKHVSFYKKALLSNQLNQTEKSYFGANYAPSIAMHLPVNEMVNNIFTGASRTYGLINHYRNSDYRLNRLFHSLGSKDNLSATRMDEETMKYVFEKKAGIISQLNYFDISKLIGEYTNHDFIFPYSSHAAYQSNPRLMHAMGVW